ncbi:MAG: LysR family transcriptional regulator [Bryobacteraceae bacterium]|nr:LysR family transcriptional regulator [Bryobacteraceae bacterium]
MVSKTPILDLRLLEYFCAVARTRSFTRAAEELGVAQPSLSEQIKKLEGSLGAPLFERLSRRIELTPVGEALLPKARALLEEAAALPLMLDALREGVRGDLRVGAIPTMLPYFLAPKLRQFVDAHPDVNVHLREATTPELIEQIQDGVLDIAILSVPVEGQGLVMSELFREPLSLAVPDDHPLASLASVDLRQISTERLLVLKEGHCLRDETLTVCQRARVKFAGQFEADQFASIFELIRAGFGVSIVPEMARLSALGCRLIPLDQRASRKVGFIRLERHYVSKPIAAFIAFLREVAKSYK